MSLFPKCLSSCLAVIFSIVLCMAEEAPVLSDWEARQADWNVAMAAVVECGKTTVPELSLERQEESKGYAAYLQSKYLLSMVPSPKEADAEVIMPLLIQAVDAFPDDLTTVGELVTFRNSRHECQLLIHELNALLERHPDSLCLLRALAATLMDEQQMEHVEEILVHLLELNPHDPISLVLWGEFLFSQNRSEELEAVIQAVNSMPDEECLPDLLHLAIRHYRRKERLDEAFRQAERLIRLPEVYQNYREAYQVPPTLTSLHAWELLRQFVATFEKHNGNNIPRDLRHRLCRACTNANLALRDYDALAKYLEELISTAGNDIDLFNIFTIPIELLLEDEEQLDKDPQRLLELSARAYETMMLRAPHDMKTRRHLCLLYRALDAPQKALAILSTIQPPTPEDQLFMAELLGRLKRYDEALAIYEKFENGQKNRQYRGPGYYLQYGCLAEENGETERAIQLLRKGFKAYPKSHQLANSLGYILADHHLELEEAKRLIEYAVQSIPHSPAYLDSLAWVYYRQSDFGKALLYMAKAVRYSALSVDELDQELRDHLQAILRDAGYPILAEDFAPLQH